MVIAIPAVFLGVGAGYAINGTVRFGLFNIIQLYTDYNLTSSSLQIGLSIGILVPFIANLFPLRKALDSNLRASLDIHHKNLGEITILMTKIQDVAGFSLTQTILAITLAVFGFLVFIGGARSFFSQDIFMFLTIMMIVLLLVTVGMVFVLQIFQQIIQNILIKVCMHTCCRIDRQLEVLLRNNINAHKKRNEKVAIMFTFTMLFLMYSACLFALLEYLADAIVTLQVASDIALFDPLDLLGVVNSKSYLDEK